MLPHAVNELVAYTPGSAFYADGSGRNNIRLSFSYPSPAFIHEGVRRLSTVIAAELVRVQ
jgi:DNA-binding transcriptional MocR family regulator